MGVVTISRKGPKNVDNFTFGFWACFLLKNKFFQHRLTRVTNRKLCFLQLKLSMFTFYPKIASRKKTSKNTSKIVKKQVLKPEKWASCRGETLGCEKAVFLQKQKKTWFGFICKMGAPPPKPCFLQWIRMIFTRKNRALFGSILAPFGTLMFPKPCYLQWISMILERSFLSTKMSK